MSYKYGSASSINILGQLTFLRNKSLINRIHCEKEKLSFDMAVGFTKWGKPMSVNVSTNLKGLEKFALVKFNQCDSRGLVTNFGICEELSVQVRRTANFFTEISKAILDIGIYDTNATCRALEMIKAMADGQRIFDFRNYDRDLWRHGENTLEEGEGISLCDFYNIVWSESEATTFTEDGDGAQPHFKLKMNKHEMAYLINEAWGDVDDLAQKHTFSYVALVLHNVDKVCIALALDEPEFTDFSGQTVFMPDVEMSFYATIKNHLSHIPNNWF